MIISGKDLLHVINRTMKNKNKSCKVVKSNGYLQLSMPNGDLIPQQTGLVINNVMGANPKSDVVLISVTCNIEMTVDEFFAIV